MIFYASAAVTAAFLIYCAVMDIRERMIYPLPALVISLSWITDAVPLYEDSLKLFLSCILTSLVMVFAFKLMELWGKGDSYMLFLFSTVLLAAVKAESLRSYFFFYLCGLTVSLILSLFIGLIEAKVRGQKISKELKIAVVPGFSIVIIALLLWTVIKGTGVFA